MAKTADYEVEQIKANTELTHAHARLMRAQAAQLERRHAVESKE